MVRRLDSTQGSMLGLRAGHVRRSDALARRLEDWAARDARAVHRHPAAKERVVLALQRALDAASHAGGDA